MTTQVTIEMGAAVTSSTAIDVPPSVKRTVAQQPKKDEAADKPQDVYGKFRELRICYQLLIIYGALTVLAFVLLLGICAYLTGTVETLVIEVSRTELTNQIVNNSKLVMKETSMVLDSRLTDGFAVLVQPSVFATYQYLAGTSSLEPVTTYADQSVGTLKPPLSTDGRYHCVSTANDAVTGCDAASRLQQISTGASSVYATGAPLTGADPFAPATPGLLEALNGTSTSDWFTPAGWAAKTAWVDTFLAGVDVGRPIFRQYPGAVGALNVTRGTSVRSYNPATRGWYRNVVSRGALPAVSSSSAFLPARPMVIEPPYIDAFGRGYLLTISCALAGPDGKVVGVAGADLPVSSLQEIVTVIKSRESGEAHFFVRATGKVVASRQLDAAYSVTSVPHIDDLALPGAPALRFADLHSGDGSTRSLFADPSFTFDKNGSGAVARIAGSGASAQTFQLVWQLAWADEFVLLTATPMDEIQAPIEVQVAPIGRAIASVFANSLIICLVCLVLLVVLTVNISARISGPMAKTVDQSHTIVNNIGGDLFKGVDLAKAEKRGELEEGWRGQYARQLA